jgi:hypothetical protein
MGLISFHSSLRSDDGTAASLPSLLSGEALIQEREDLGDVELDVFEVEFLLAVFLHLEEIVEL